LRVLNVAINLVAGKSFQATIAVDEMNFKDGSPPNLTAANAEFDNCAWCLCPGGGSSGIITAYGSWDRAVIFIW
jgi:hypothetical protein